jgi:hypothetical protein
LSRVSIVGAVDLEDRLIQVAGDWRDEGDLEWSRRADDWLAVNSSSPVATRYSPSRFVRDVTLALSLTGRLRADTYACRYEATSSLVG